MLTDVPGLLRDPDETDTLIKHVRTPSELEALQDAAEGFMRRKVMAATDALDGGAVEVIVADANEATPVSSALAGGGTHLLPEAVA
jgi:acetylglutamate/LysW-gamma-L-alpha-aminoadipate kinase